MYRAKRRRPTQAIRPQGPQSLTPTAHRLFLEAVSHHQAKRFSQAEECYTQILTQFPSHCDSLHLRGLLAYQQGQHTLALELIQKALSLDATKAHYFFNQALVLEKLEGWDDAVNAYRQAIQLNPNYVEAHSNMGNVFRRQRHWAKAVAAYEQALRLNPQSADLCNNLGVVYKDKGEREQALGYYHQAVRLDPQHAEAYNNMGVVLQDQDKLDEAASAFHQALSLKPDYANAHYHFGLVQFWQGQQKDALAGFQRSTDLTYNHRRGVAPAFVTKARVKHDYEQLQYLAEQTPSLPFPDTYQGVLRTLYHRIAHSSSDSIFLKLTPEEQSQMAPSFNQFVYRRPTGSLEGKAINPSLNVDVIETRYFSSSPEAMYVDELLTEEALSELRAFCLESTIWKRDYPNGYIGTFLANGFACPLLLQIAEELRIRFPRIFQHHQLQQAWAFKHDSALRGLNMHADAAAVNVNFWITPDEANRNPQNGGLVVWDKEAPDDWDFADYNNDKNRHKIKDFLDQSGASPISIPHRQNRAVIFNSNLFHETDVIEFQDSYETRRINVTLLYGHRQQAHQS